MKKLERIQDENAKLYAYRTILHNIIQLELPPGSAVSENELSASLELSRTPIREALLEMRRLELIETIPQKGSYVTKIDYKLIDDAHFIRMSLENSIVRLACRQGISASYLRRIRENLKQQKNYEQTPEAYFTMIELDNAFHKLLFESVQKLHAYEVMQTQMVHFDRLRTISFQTLKLEKFSKTINDHENIFYALEKRDEELAEMVMTRHLTRHQSETEELERLRPEYFK